MTSQGAKTAYIASPSLLSHYCKMMKKKKKENFFDLQMEARG